MFTMFTIHSYRELSAIDAEAINLVLTISRDIPDVSVEFLLHKEGAYPFGGYEYDFVATYKFRGQDVWTTRLEKERVRGETGYRYIDVSLEYNDFPQTLFERRFFHRQSLISRISASLDAEISDAKKRKEDLK